ncbi:MAG: hypothetical protein WCI51_13815 [Lentisphaerota bacterium]
MRVYVVWICSFLVTLAVLQAADVAKPATKTVVSTKTAAQLVDMTISRDGVLGFLNESNRVFLEGEKGKPATAIKYISTAGMVKAWLNIRFLEADTEIDRGWYERVYKMLDYMAKSKDFIELAMMNGRTKTPEYKKISDNFDEAQKRFSELLKEPTPVEQKKLEKLREEKRKWELTHKREKAKSGGIKEEE